MKAPSEFAFLVDELGFEEHRVDDWVAIGEPAPLALTARSVCSYGTRLLQPEVFFRG
jgi:hypothetical protein